MALGKRASFAARCVVVVAVLWGAPALAHASGLKTHLWIAQQILDDIVPDCRVTLVYHSYPVDADVCEAIRAHPGAFLSGALGPDAYPDLITGQVTAHPGVEGGFTTADWLKHLHTAANTGEEIAFTAGYLTHAAADAFTHTYVNAYSGDIFELGDERAVERRHFILEKYIDYRLPPGEPDPSGMRVPAQFLARRLILNEDAARNAAGSGVALHIPAMYGVYVAVGDLADGLDGLEKDLGSLLGETAARAIDFQARIATQEHGLKAARETMQVAEDALTIQENALADVQREFDKAAGDLENNLGTITLADAQIKGAREGAAAARQAMDTYEDAVHHWSRIESELLDAGVSVADNICRTIVDAICNIFGCDDDKLCEPTSEALDLRRARVRLADAYRDLARSRNRLAEHVANEAAAIDAKARYEAATEGLRLARDSTRMQLDLVRTTTIAQRDVVRTARENVERLQAELEKLREALLDTEKLKASIEKLVAQSDILSAYAKNWEKGIETASAKYIETGLDVTKKLVRGEGGAFGAYGEWISCYGGAFTPTPIQVTSTACNVQTELERLDALIDEFIIDYAPPPLDQLYERYLSLRRMIKEELRFKAGEAALEIAKLAAPDAATADFIDLIAKPENATEAKLNEAFAEVGDADGKPLLTFASVSDLINRDARMANGQVNPRAFAALRHSIVLAKLSLLGKAQLRELTYRLGGNLAELDLTGPDRRYSILYEALRSIDGNHQWQPYGLPYASADGAAPRPADPRERRYGYGPADDGPYGLPIFRTPGLRRTVFANLFPLPVSGALAARPELKAPTYPFPECQANPFPVAFNPDGSPKASDDGCRTSNWVAREFSTFGNHLLRAWRRVLAGLGARPWMATP